ncbi:MAG: hypothetical protein FJX31_03240 [Alphaproteobacteria bacterium]|nr:hypothetical protein [Alphaproteobacteria bacterium]
MIDGDDTVRALYQPDRAGAAAPFEDARAGPVRQESFDLVDGVISPPRHVQPDQRVDAVDRARQVFEHAGQRVFLVVAGDLDDELEALGTQGRKIDGNVLGLDRPVHVTHR